MSTNAPLTCQIVIGLMVPRPCGEKAKHTCKGCHKPFCQDHAGEGGRCQPCTRGETQATPVMAVPFDLAFDPADLEQFQVQRSDDPNDAWSDLT